MLTASEPITSRHGNALGSGSAGGEAHAVAALPAPCAQVRATTHAFFLDVDGTLIDLAPHPDAVEIPAGLPATLGALFRCAGGALALVSGRGLASLDALFGPAFPAAGSHGAQLRPRPGEDSWTAAPLAPDLASAIVETAAGVAQIAPGVFAEDKGTAIAVHYRAAPQAASRLAESLTRLVAGREDVRLLPGHFVFEIKRAGYDKGTALDRFMADAPFRGRIPVFIGDDVTDEAGFRAARAHGGLAIAVGAPREGADVVLPGPEAVRAYLTHLAAEPRQHWR